MGDVVKRTHWSTEQLDLLRMFYPNFNTENVAFMVGHSLSSTYQKARALGLKKKAELVASESARRMTQFDHPAREHRFQKGLMPWNKGVKGLKIGGEATQFRVGQMPHNTQPIGSYRLDGDGTLQRKISNDRGSNSKRWRGVHELVWVEANGPVPPKHIVVFKPGMRTDVLDQITLDKVECISLAQNMKRNTRHNLPKELNEVIHLRAVLTRQINKRSKQNGTESNDPRSA
jgi:hypothetical protein